MLARLGNVFYWVGCIVAGPFIALAGYGFFMTGRT
jgi:hypothetical protein